MDILDRLEKWKNADPSHIVEIYHENGSLTGWDVTLHGRNCSEVNVISSDFLVGDEETPLPKLVDVLEMALNLMENV